MAGLTIRVFLLVCLVYSAASHHLKVKRQAPSLDPTSGVIDPVTQLEGDVGVSASGTIGQLNGATSGLDGSVDNVEGGVEGSTSELTEIESQLLSQIQTLQHSVSQIQQQLDTLEASLAEQAQSDVNNLPSL